MLIDSHCHLDKLKIFKSINNLIFFLKKNKIKNVLSVSVNIKNFFSLFSRLSYINQNIIKLSCGIHPLYIKDMDKDDLFLLEKFLLFKNVIAIGESGLDYKFISNNLDKKKQIDIFNYHLFLCKKYKKPCIIHSRFSEIDTINEIKKFDINDFGAIIHSYSYLDKKILYKFIDLGLYISLSGLITFKSFYKIKDIINYIPLDRLLVETDSPYLTPYNCKGLNNPTNIIFIIKKISYLRKISFYKILLNTNKNFINLFNI